MPVGTWVGGTVGFVPVDDDAPVVEGPAARFCSTAGAGGVKGTLVALIVLSAMEGFAGEVRVGGFATSSRATVEL